MGKDWKDDPRDLIRAGEDFDLDAMERAATPGWRSGKKSAETFCHQRGDLRRRAVPAAH